MEEDQPEGEWKVPHTQYKYAYIHSKLQCVYVGHCGLNRMPHKYNKHTNHHQKTSRAAGLKMIRRSHTYTLSRITGL